ncbi:4Fe-4S binding protein, partial [Thermodesulfobacteriota bacterium]
ISDLVEKIEKILSAENMKDFLKEKAIGPLKFHHEFRVSISGCPNACSRPQIVDIGIIGLSTPEINKENCNGCAKCQKVCREGVVSFIDGIPEIDKSKCLLCGQCVKTCDQGAMEEGAKGFKVLIGGKLGRHPRLALAVPGLFNMKETINIINRLVRYYKENCLNGECFGELLEKKQIFDLNQGGESLDEVLCVET